MTAFDRIKPFAAGILAVALVVQIWYEFSAFGKEPITFSYVLRFATIVVGIALLATYGRSALVKATLRIVIAADFAHSIADRFGVLGPYHAVGVAWGNWTNFVYYTHILTGLLPTAVAPSLAVFATLLEAALAICLVFGILPRLASLVTASLLAIYIATMSATSGFVSQLDYAVLLLASAALFVACSGDAPALGESTVPLPMK